MSTIRGPEWRNDIVPPPSRTLHELIDGWGRTTPTAPALVCGDTRLSYSDLAKRGSHAAAALESLGVGAGSKVGLMAPNCSTWLEVALGAMRLGARVDAFNTWVKAWDLEHLLASSGVEVLVMASTAGSTNLLEELRSLLPELWSGPAETWNSQRFPNLRRVALLDGSIPVGADGWNQLFGESGRSEVPTIEANGNDIAVVVYTSGSTQRPKAVPLRHRPLVENGFAIGERMGLKAQDRVWLGSPLFWSFGIANAVMATFSHGGCLVLQERFDPNTAAQLMAQEECTAAYLLPSMADALVSSSGPEMRAIGTLRKGLTFGRPEEIRRVVEELEIRDVCNIYGSTETYGNCCVTPYWLPLSDRVVTQGEPLPGMSVRIVDPESGVVVPLGEAGEIQVRGRVMTGYLNVADSGESVFTKDGWFRTGDTGLLRADDRLQFLARHSEMIKTSGINVSPAEVESFIATHTGVREVAVVGAPHDTRGQVVVAFITTTLPSPTADEIIDFCRRSMAGYKVPQSVHIVEQLPRTTTGKLSRQDLVRIAASS